MAAAVPAGSPLARRHDRGATVDGRGDLGAPARKEIEMRNMSCGWIAGAARAQWLAGAVAISLIGCVPDDEQEESPGSTESEIAGGVDTWERPEIGMLMTPEGMCTATL